MHRAGSDPGLAVELEGLTKIYRGGGRESLALDRVDLAIRRGEIFGLLGPNGAGKSTLINILAGLVIKTAGTAKVWGIDIDRDPRNARATIGVVTQEVNIDSFFTPRELLGVQAGFYGVPKRERRTEELLELLGLADKADDLARTLSGGMRRRLMMAKAMVHAPPVLVLDEPTAGVDVELRRQLWTNIQSLAASGTTILLTTHYLDEAQELCGRIAIIDHGRVVACDTTPALLAKIDEKLLTLSLVKPVLALPPGLAALGLKLDGPERIVFRYQAEPRPCGRCPGRGGSGRSCHPRRFQRGDRSRGHIPAPDRRGGGSRSREMNGAVKTPKTKPLRSEARRILAWTLAILLTGCAGQGGLSMHDQQLRQEFSQQAHRARRDSTAAPSSPMTAPGCRCAPGCPRRVRSRRWCWRCTASTIIPTPSKGRAWPGKMPGSRPMPTTSADSARRLCAGAGPEPGVWRRTWPRRAGS